MTSFLLRLEAIESRIASNSCPRGIPGGLYAVRLRRCFHNNYSRPSAALGQAIQDHPYHDPLDGELAWAQRHPDTNGCANVEARQAQYSEQRDVRNQKVDSIFGAARGSPEYQEWQENIQEYLRTQAMPRSRAKAGTFGDALQILPPESRKAPPTSLQEQEHTLLSALRTRDPHAVMKTVLGLAALDRGVPSLLLSILPPIFSEVLRCMDPKHFIDRHSDLYKTVSSSTMRLLGLSQQVRQEDYHQFSTLFLSQVKDIIDARQQTWPLTISDYKYLLKCARSIGHARATEEIWKSMTTRIEEWRSDGTANSRVIRPPLVPDAECYNHYLTVKCWRDVLNPHQRYRLRVIPDNLVPRNWEKAPYTLGGHRAGRGKGIKAQVSNLFREMVENGIAGNEETFRLMIIALAREGDIVGVESILKRVWAIDVPALMSSTNLPPAMSYSRGSPFYPSEHFLFTICHAYGINNNIPTALRLIDYISRQYSIPVSIEAWEELLEWTFVLTKKKSMVRKRYDREGKPAERGLDIGMLPPQAVTNLWQTMVSEPYNVQPTMKMYNKCMSNLLYRQRFGEMQVRMEEARELLKKDILALTRKNIFLTNSIRQGAPIHVTEKRARDYVLALLRVGRNRQYIKRWVRLLLHHGTKQLRGVDEWLFQSIPNIVQKWSLFLPNRLRYQVLTGELIFNTHVKEEHRRRAIRRINGGVGIRTLGLGPKDFLDRSFKQRQIVSTKGPVFERVEERNRRWAKLEEKKLGGVDRPQSAVDEI